MNLTPTQLRTRGIELTSYEYLASECHTIHDPEVIQVTLTNAREETFRTNTFCKDRHTVLKPDDYLQLVLDRYYEREEEAFKRSFQYKQWGTPISQSSHWVKKPGAEFRNEFDYYHFSGSEWYEHNIRKPMLAFQQRFEAFISPSK